MGFHDHFSARAAQYASSRPTYPAALAEFLASECEHPGLAWEAGCGSGQLTRDVAQYFRHVAATDPSHAQIRHAPHRPGIWYWCATAEASGLGSRSADCAFAAQAAHWFQLETYYAEVRRVVRTGGIVALISYGGTQVGADIEAVVQHFHREVLGSCWPPERKHVDAGYATLPFPFPEIDAPQFEMRIEWTGAQYGEYVRTWSAVKALEEAGEGEKLQEFFEVFFETWPANETKVVRWPLALRIGRVD